MRSKIIIGNWKMNKISQEAKEFFESVSKLIKTNENKIDENLKYGVAVPSTLLNFSTHMVEEDKRFVIAAQNMHEAPSGAYTGELSVDMLKDAHATAVIIGHSERRKYFNETNETVNAKTKVALENGLLPIVCVGETLEEFEANKTKEVLKEQIEKSLKGITQWDKVVVAYEPIWAIGTGKTATPEQAQEACAFIRGLTSEELLIQYGGSVKPANVEELLNQKDIDGALVGGASLEAESFVKLLTLNK
ncbi:MAG: triose-phosphate isomerase [Mycoplasma sp.]|nr:triose-phosphate isomerase [Mycoplasma sp.]